MGARGAHLQIRLGQRLQFLQGARRGREAVGRRTLIRPDELPQDRRPRRRRDQVGRHDAARGQDGHGRYRSSRHRGLCRLEGDRGAESGGARRRLEARPEAPQSHHGRLQSSRDGSARRRPLRSGAERRLEARDPRGAPRLDPRELCAARDPVRGARLCHHRLPHLRHGLGQRGLSHRLRPELQQLGAADQRFPRARARGRRMAPQAAHRRQGRKNAQGARIVGQDRQRRLGERRSGGAVRHHHQRMAHLPAERPHQCVQPVLGIHVPRRHGLQSRIAQPLGVPARGRNLRHRRLRACGAAVDDHARDLGADGAVPVARHRPALLRLPHARAGLCQCRRPLDGVRAVL